MTFENYKYAQPTRQINKMLVPINNFNFDEDGATEFNAIYQYCMMEESRGTMRRFELTDGGSICTSIGSNRGARWLLTHTRTLIEIFLKDYDGKLYRFIIGHLAAKEGRTIKGHQAFIIYNKQLKKDGVNLEDYAISDKEEAYSIKLTIPPPLIEVVVPIMRTYYNAFHLDINSAFNAGMMKAYPFLEKSIRRMYDERANKPTYKQVLNMTQGYMQSSLVNYKYSHISKAGHEWTRNRIIDLSERLRADGFRILSYNTDGIWYQSPNGLPYHDEDEGPEIGQWKTDHYNCKIRYKSKGCYEYVEDGVYTPVFRGVSNFEKLKARENWEWGDIFEGDVITYYFDEEEGVIFDNQ